jgi:uncharacterized membrane protein YraQ (UPF0718 family)
MDKKRLIGAGKSVLKSMKMSMPILVGVLLLVGLATASIPKDFFRKLFTGNMLFDPIKGAILGSVAAGNPLTSYLIGGELLQKGISMAAVIAFILSWVTVGLVQLPAESLMLGRKFAIVRNGISFVMAIIVSLLMSFTLELL